MANSIAIVASLEGQAWAKKSDGTLRPLKVGDTVTAEETVITATGARIELDFGDGKPLAIAGGQEVLMGKDMWTELAADKQDAAVDNASVQEALTVLNQGGDLTTALEETAAGLNGGGSNEGHSFVALTRILENTDPNAFNFGANNPDTGTTPNSLASADQINHAPQMDAQSFTGDEDTTIAGQIIATDVENDVLIYSLVGQPANGTITLNPTTGSFVYTPNSNYNGPDSFVVTVTDDHGNSTTTTIGLTVNAVNDAPVSSDQNLTTPEDTPLPGQVVATDVDGDTLSYSVSSTATHGTVTLNPATGAFVYTPGANYNGSDKFVVTISDGQGGTTTSTINIGVTPVNDAPVSSDQNLTTPEDTPLPGQVVATDVDGDTLSYSVSSTATHGTVTLNPATGAFVYTPGANYSGSDKFVVTISDGQGGTTTSTINIGVTPVNDAPVSSDQNLTTPEDTPLPGQVVATDVDGDTLSYSVSSTATHGTVTLNPATGAFVYTPGANYNGSDKFVVTISDGQGGTTTSTINIGVTPVNDVATLSTDEGSVTEDTTLSTGGTLIITDPDAGEAAFQPQTSVVTTFGTFSVNSAGVWSYTLNNGLPAVQALNNGQQLTDTINVLSVDGTPTNVVITINGTDENAIPIAVNDPAGIAYSVQLGDASASDLWTSVDSKGLSVVVNAYNANGTAGSLYQNAVDSNSHTLGVTGTPRTNTNPVPDQIEYDQTTGKSEAIELVLNGNVNQATFSVSRMFPGENGGEMGMWSVYYKGALVSQSSFRLTGSANTGSFTINTGNLVFDSVKFSALNTNDATGDGGDYFLTGFSASGDSSSNTGYTIAEGALLTIGSGSSLKLISNDTDSNGDSLLVTKINNANVNDGDTISLTYGSLVIHTDGSFSYSANNANSLSSGQVVTDEFNYTISDGHGGTSTAIATVTVVGRDLTGTSGSNVLEGEAYSEQIVGGGGNDTMTGGVGADTFKWSLNDQGSKGSPAVDTITDFTTGASGDILDLRDLLQSENSSNLTNFLHFASDGTNTTVSISSTGSFNGSNYSAMTDQTIVLNGVDLTGSDAAIIDVLKVNNLRFDN